MQFQILPVEERFYVRLNDEATGQYPSGAFSQVSNYPVYAVRMQVTPEQDITEFLIPGSDAHFYWIDMRHTRLSRR